MKQNKNYSGGWFSCFSNTAVDYPAPNMISFCQSKDNQNDINF
jgi:hypothetical protein